MVSQTMVPELQGQIKEAERTYVSIFFFFGKIGKGPLCVCLSHHFKLLLEKMFMGLMS